MMLLVFVDKVSIYLAPVLNQTPTKPNMHLSELKS